MYAIFCLLIGIVALFVHAEYDVVVILVAGLITIFVSVFGLLAAHFQTIGLTVFSCVILVIDILKNLVKSFFSFLFLFFFFFSVLMLCVCVCVQLLVHFIHFVVCLLWVDQSFFYLFLFIYLLFFFFFWFFF